MSDDRAREIAGEQRIVDAVHARLEPERAHARELATDGLRRSAAGPSTGLVERDAMVLTAGRRLRSLDAEAEGIVFGRLDLDDGESYHVGRLGLRDEHRRPLLIDWRAPAVMPFYRATPGDPMGVVRRRVITCRGPRVIDLDDDVLLPDQIGDRVVIGEGALLAAVRRSRGPHMRDIVATIQREQDEAIRAPARGVTLVTGGPGTGKTQVALHRAAYLLYTDRGRFADGRVLVVGPSTVFTSYIGRVLPSLGEDSVRLRSLGELVDDVTATRRDPAPLAEIKGAGAMRPALADLVWQPPPDVPDRLRMTYAGQVLTLDADALAAARRRVRDRAGTPNTARRAAAGELLAALWSTLDTTGMDRATFTGDVAGRADFRRFLTAWWPVLTPEAVLCWLSDPARLAGTIGAPAAATLAASYRAAADWSVDDVPLLDELSVLLGEPPVAAPAEPAGWRPRELGAPARPVDHYVLSWAMHDGWSLYAPGMVTPLMVAPSIEDNAVGAARHWAGAVLRSLGHRVVAWRDGTDPHGEEGYLADLAEPLPTAEPEDEPDDPAGTADYSHVILDEAQDLSPMECRMIARRSRDASMTIVGDPAQATHPLAAASWDDLLTRLDRRGAHVLDLHTGYRVPGTIAEFANRVADRVLPPGTPPTTSYRPGGTLSVRRVDDLAAAVAAAAREAGDGTAAVIAADHAADALTAAAGDVPVVPASLAKGLEYDHVIVVEPADIVAAEPRGLNRLYVVLTRAVDRLVVLHRADLPAPLRQPSGG